MRPQGDWYAAAASTRPANSPASAAVSGCHCTATQNRSPGASIASSVPSLGVRRRRRSPGARAPTGGGGSCTDRRVADERRHPACPDAVVDLDLAEHVAARAVLARGRPGRARAGRASRRRAPPSPACRGRRRARQVDGSAAASSRASSQASRSARQLAVRGCGVLAVALRVDVGAAGDDQAVEARDRRPSAASGSASVGGSSTGMPPRDVTASAYCGRQQVGALVPDAPARLLAVGGEADERRSHGSERRDVGAGDAAVDEERARR